MIDREKVIIGLERCKLFNKVNCDKCPYDYNGRGDGKSECTAELASDALALLKEKEAVKPRSVSRHGANPQIQHFCGNCNSMLHGKPKFCSVCGKAVKWE